MRTVGLRDSLEDQRRGEAEEERWEEGRKGEAEEV
jgi:hypothetical protein